MDHLSADHGPPLSRPWTTSQQTMDHLSPSVGVHRESIPGIEGYISVHLYGGSISVHLYGGSISVHL